MVETQFVILSHPLKVPTGIRERVLHQKRAYLQYHFCCFNESDRDVADMKMDTAR